METNNLLNILSGELPAAGSYIISAGSSSGSIIAGSTSISVGTSTANGHTFLLNSPGVNFSLPTNLPLDVFQQKYYEQPDLSEAVIDQITSLIDKLSATEDQNQLHAVKHLTYAKAFLEKMLLDKINEKTNGDS
jgi:hypothetical protein